MAPERLLLLSDSPKGPMAQDLNVLYPGMVEALDFRTSDHGAAVLSGFDAVITAVHDGTHLSALDYAGVVECARSGGTVVSCLFEYAQHFGLDFSKTHVGDRLEPAMRIEAENDVTVGFTRGDTVWWYGTVSSAPDTSYVNQMFQRQVFGVRESADVSVLATSTVNGGAAMVDHRIGGGRVLALDLMSPNRPFYNSHGSTNKYLFLGNLLGGSVRYGRQYPERLSYDAFVELMHGTAARYERLRIQREEVSSDGRPMWSLHLGDEASPTVYFGAAIHGWEWENAFGLLRLAEVLAEQPDVEGLSTDNLHVCLVPIQNPYGYDHFVRQNARGVDLNRNFDCGWEELPVVQDLVLPWDYNYKGTRPASEPETQVVQTLIDRHAPVCVIDFHTADYVMLTPHKGDADLLSAIQDGIGRRLKNRYLTQKPYSGPYQQVNMERTHPNPNPVPYLICYAAEKGVPAAFLIEMSGNRDDVHALVMNTDTVVEICLAAIKEWLDRHPA